MKTKIYNSTGLAFAFAMVYVLAVLTIQAQAQTYQVLHTFSGGGDGAYPKAGVWLDGAGNLYGTASGGGIASCRPVGCGTVYKLQPRGSGWTLNTLYSFKGGSDSEIPYARVILRPDGHLYGTTLGDGSSNFGTVFNLRPFPSVCKTALCPWMETILFSFNGTDQGYGPDGDLAFDGNQNIYGTTSGGGNRFGDGLVYQLSPDGKQTVLHYFGSGNDGELPYGGVILNSGNLYGTTFVGGSNGAGTVYEASPTESGWVVTDLANFSAGDDIGDKPHAGVIFDDAGNLYGTTVEVNYSGGSVFQLTPSNDGWTLNTLYTFTSPLQEQCGPYASLVMDSAGNLYGTTLCDGAYGYGNVFKLTPPYGQQNYTSLHDFCAAGPPCSDGAYPVSNVVFDKDGNLYGTATGGGDLSKCDGSGCGVVWEITP